MKTIKSLTLLFVLFCIILLNQSCEKEDPCESLICQNGGTCVEGSCDCPDGFAGQNCEIVVDLCENVICEEPQICNEGECTCPDGYTGSNCDDEVIPTKVTVKEILITKFPENSSNGDPWDEIGKPDIAVAIYDGQEQLFFSEIMNDVNFSDISVFPCNHLFWMADDILKSYDIPVTEWDGIEYQLVGIMPFTPYNAGLNFPDTVAITTLEAINTVEGKLILEYGF